MSRLRGQQQPKVERAAKSHVGLYGQPKVSFLSEANARAAAESRGAESRRHVGTYRRQTCALWHIGGTEIDAAHVDGDGLQPSHRRVLDALLAADPADWVGRHRLGELVAVDDTGLGWLRERTVQAAAEALTDLGLIEACASGTGSAFAWRAVRPDTEGENAV